MVTITATSQALATETMSVTATVVFGNAVLSGPYAFSTTGRTDGESVLGSRGKFLGRRRHAHGHRGYQSRWIAQTTVTHSPHATSPDLIPSVRMAAARCNFARTPVPPARWDRPPQLPYFRIVVDFSPAGADDRIQFSGHVFPAHIDDGGGEMISQDPSVFPQEAKICPALTRLISRGFDECDRRIRRRGICREWIRHHQRRQPAAPLRPARLTLMQRARAPCRRHHVFDQFQRPGHDDARTDFTFSFYPVSAGRAKFIEIDRPLLPQRRLIRYWPATRTTSKRALNLRMELTR